MKQAALKYILGVLQRQQYLELSALGTPFAVLDFK
jgi:hypothetical protein